MARIPTKKGAKAKKAPKLKVVRMTPRKENPHRPGKGVHQEGYKNSLTDEEVEQTREAVVAAGGNMAEAARVLGINRRTLYKRIENRPELWKEMEDAREATLDLAEAKLKVAVENGDAWAICFTLKCLGKTRGYIERKEVGVDNKTGRQPKAESLSDDELERIASGEE